VPRQVGDRQNPGQNELDAVAPAARLPSAFLYLLPITGAASTSSSASTARM
jgi:hypothetical protein